MLQGTVGVVRRVCIVANSPECDPDLVALVSQRADLVIATDGALTQIDPSVRVDVVCGDFDSVSEAQARIVRPEVEVILRPDQDKNDLEKSIAIALERGAADIEVLGAWGGRLDQSLTTLAVLECFSAQARMVMYHDTWVCRLLQGPGVSAVCDIETRRNDTISIVARNSAARISIDNVRWPLTDYSLEVGSRGVSNESLGGIVRVEVHEGIVALCHQR